MDSDFPGLGEAVRLHPLLFGFGRRLGRDAFGYADVMLCAAFLVLGLLLSAIALFAFDLHRVSVKGAIPCAARPASSGQ